MPRMPSWQKYTAGAMMLGILRDIMWTVVSISRYVMRSTAATDFTFTFFEKICSFFFGIK